MDQRPSVLCPVDFSNASRAALRYALAIAEHFGARLTLVTVNDPLVTEAAELELGLAWLPDDSQRELRRFFSQTFEHRSIGPVEVDYEVVVGRPGPEILRVAAERRADLIIMSTNGLTGARKMFFGSTTERVLRETDIPVLVTPGHDSGPLFAEDVTRLVRRVLVPVDLTAATPRQVRVARGLAKALGVPLILAHVVEPVRLPLPSLVSLPNVDVERRARAEQCLSDLLSTMPPGSKSEALAVYGDPAEEIAQIARTRDAGLIIIGLHATMPSGPRMGSVTFRVICLAHSLVLALPPSAGDRPTYRMASEELEAGGFTPPPPCQTEDPHALPHYEHVRASPSAQHL